MAHYPLFVDLTGRRCVVVGGGGVAEGKVLGLLAAGAIVTVVSPALTPSLADAVRAGRIAHRARGYRDGDLDGAALAFAATGEPEVNAAVAAEGRRRGIWINAADDPGHCDFILPAVVRRGALAVAVSTGGASPAAARAVREELERLVGEQYATLVDVAADVRRGLRGEGARLGAHAWSDALRDVRFRRLISAGRRDEARQRLRACLEGAGERSP
jgi:siroheme synthase-like protein